MMNREELIAALSNSKEKTLIISKWSDLLISNHSITEVFTSEGKSSVALYEPEREPGSAEILIHELLLHDIPIECIITDDSAGEAIGGRFGIACVSHEDIAAKVKADFVVVLSSEGFFGIRASLRSVIPAEVISLLGLVELANVVKFVTPEAALQKQTRHCDRFCVLTWPRVWDFNDAELTARLENIEFSPRKYQENPERFKPLYRDIEEYSDEYISEIFQERPIIQMEGHSVHADCVGRFVNIIGGRRLTMGHPEDAEYGVYLLGGCNAYGFGADDRYTIAAYLQRKVNDYYGSAQNSTCAVYNAASWGSAQASGFDFMKRDRKKKKIGILAGAFSDVEYPKGRNGKVHRFIQKHMVLYGMDYFDMTATLYEVEKRAGTYLDSTHTNHRGFKAVADRVWDDFLKPILESGELSDENSPSEPLDALPLAKKWRMLREASHSASEFFTGRGVRSVGLVCASEHRDILSGLATDLTEDGIGVTLIVNDDAPDEAPAFPNAGRLRSSEIEAGAKLDIDIAVIPGLPMEKEWGKALLGTECVSLGDMIGLMWDKFFFYPEIAEEFEGSAAYLCLCFWPGIDDLGLPPSPDLSKVADEFADSALERNYVYLGTNLYNDIPNFSKAYLSEVTRADADAGPTENPDRRGIAVNVKNAVRRTVDQPSGAKRCIHVFGGGTAFGIGTEDKFTIPSFLQGQMNLRAKNSKSEPIRVENEGLCRNRVGDLDILKRRITRKLRGGNIADGDIVLWLIDKRYTFTESEGTPSAYLTACLGEHGIQVLDLTGAMRAAQGKLAYIDKKHINQRGNKITATKLYMDYVKRVLEGSIPAPARKPKALPLPEPDPAKTTGTMEEYLTGEQNAEFKRYLEYLESERRDTHTQAEEKHGRKKAHRKAKYGARKSTSGVGAVVMNCNPFTKGHRYLAERAAAEVEVLYVFVVEEDKSFFPFADRFRLASEGLRDIPNVRVLRSGKFIISTITFPGYFTKESAKEIAVDTSLDLRLFGRFIVPALGIGTRFAGSEPTDMVTRQYNLAMRETLPRYGVKFVEFERITKGETAISASTVRALLERRDWAGIEDLVPDVTYQYLREKFSGVNP